MVHVLEIIEIMMTRRGSGKGGGRERGKKKALARRKKKRRVRTGEPEGPTNLEGGRTEREGMRENGDDREKTSCNELGGVHGEPCI